MALVAFEAGVLAFQDVPGFFVVKGLCIPLDQGEIFAIVLGVAPGALLAGAGRDVVGRMQTLVSLKAAGNLGVAFQTFQGCLAAEFMTTGAISRSIQGLMRAG